MLASLSSFRLKKELPSTALRNRDMFCATFPVGVNELNLADKTRDKDSDREVCEAFAFLTGLFCSPLLVSLCSSSAVSDTCHKDNGLLEACWWLHCNALA